MSTALPRLRLNLDFTPSPDPERPGLYIRDPYHYSDATLLVPAALVEALECFDGMQSTLDLRAELVRITGEIQVGELEKHLFDSLNEAGFLENERYRELKAKREAEFADEELRDAVFAGSAYPNDVRRLSNLLNVRVGSVNGNSRGTVAIAAPHASPEGAWESYKAAYQAGPPVERAADLTFVILGTSHYGAPERFGLTRKLFETPFGKTRPNLGLIAELEQKAGDAVRMEDYCHSVEHSIEFQIIFLQHLYGPEVKILPILCGPFVKSIYEGELPEHTERVGRFFDVLGDIAARENNLFWVLGIDLAHMGRRYGDALRASANMGEMLAIEQRDRERLGRITASDIGGYWSLVQDGHDDLKWCGSAPLYTFMKVMPGLKGELLNYEQWQIDPQSVVSLSALKFSKPA